MITLSSDEAGLKNYWEKNQKEFMSEPAYEIAYVRQAPVTSSPSDKEIAAYYESNRHLFKDKDGKVMTQNEAAPMIVAALNRNNFV